MATTTLFKLRKGTTTQFSTFVGGENEVCTDTTKHTIVLMDGSTEGGYPLAREDLSNVTLSTLLDRGIAADDLANVNKNDILDKGIASSDLSNVKEQDIKNKGIAFSDATNIERASTIKVGVARFATNSETVNSDDPTIMINPVGLRACLNSYTRTLPPMYISGMYVEYENDNEIVIGTGMCRTLDDEVNILLSTPLSILMQDIELNSTYHIFIGINNEGRVSQTYSTSLIPASFISAGYVHYRRVGSIITDSDGKIIPFERVGNYVYYTGNRPVTAPTSTYTQIDLPIPHDVTSTPILYSTGDYNIGILANNYITLTSNATTNCFSTKGKIYQKGTGTCAVVGFIEHRELD